MTRTTGSRWSNTSPRTPTCSSATASARTATARWSSRSSTTPCGTMAPSGSRRRSGAAARSRRLPSIEPSGPRSGVLPYHGCMDVASLLESAARRRPGPAIVCGPTRMDYAGLKILSGRIGAVLRELGASPGDRVAALFPNCHLYLAAYFAALESDLVLVPLNLRLAPRETRAILEHSGARLVLGEPGLAAPFLEGRTIADEGWIAGPTGVGDEGARSKAPAGGAHLYYTRGTTGRPKGVVLTRDKLAAPLRRSLTTPALQERDTWLPAAPPFPLPPA